MRQALHRSSLVPRGFVVEVRVTRMIRQSSRSVHPEATAYVRRAEQFPVASIATIDDA